MAKAKNPNKEQPHGEEEEQKSGEEKQSKEQRVVSNDEPQKPRRKRKRKPSKRKTGRPQVEIDWEEFDKLIEMHCTRVEVAAWFKCSEDTIDRACQRQHGMSFAAYFDKQGPAGNVSLRRAQWQAATEDRNPAMLIWLGKQKLGQKDEARVQHAQAPAAGEPEASGPAPWRVSVIGFEGKTEADFAKLIADQYDKPPVVPADPTAPKA